MPRHCRFLPYEIEDYEKLANLEKPLEKDYMDILSSMHPYFSLLHDRIILKDLRISDDKKYYESEFINSDMLEEDKTYIYH